eukprot:3749850-Rhodomonas_salina.1
MMVRGTWGTELEYGSMGSEGVVVRGGGGDHRGGARDSTSTDPVQNAAPRINAFPPTRCTAAARNAN